MTDEKMAADVRAAAYKLAIAMNVAGGAGLMIKLEMKPHASESDTRRVYKLTEYRPILEITRTIVI